MEITITEELLFETVHALKFFLKRTKQHAAKAKLLYALELAQELEEHKGKTIAFSYGKVKELCLNGASNWQRFSEGGCSLIYNGDIVERCICPSLHRYSENKDLIKIQANFLAGGFKKLYDELRFQIKLNN